MPRSLVLDGPRRLRLAEQPSRPLEPGEIRLRARLSGISHGTELSLDPPTRLGACSGVIVKRVP
jgi:hypothetical protein